MTAHPAKQFTIDTDFFNVSLKQIDENCKTVGCLPRGILEKLLLHPIKKQGVV